MKRTVGFRFSEKTLAKLDTLSEGTTRTAVLERLVDEAYDRPASTVIQAPDPDITERLAEVARDKSKKPSKKGLPPPSFRPGTSHVRRQKIPKPEWK
jgi:predicted transcriptional regulator